MIACPHFNWSRWPNPNNTELPSIYEIVSQEFQRWLPYIKPGWRCLDVGAYTGDTAVAMAALAGPTGLVVAMEPNLDVFPTLCYNSRQSDQFAPIFPISAGLGEPGIIMHHYGDATCCNGGRLLPDREHQVRHVFGKNVVQIEPSAITALGPFDFIKLDTEGNDLAVLRGLSDEGILQEASVIQCEFYLDMNEQERKALFNLLNRRYNPHDVNGNPTGLTALLTGHHDVIWT